MGMATNAAGLLQGWNKIVCDSCENVVLFDFYGTPAAVKICD